MKPSAAQLIDAARLALEEHVAPDVTDELAASAVRSVTMILKHLAVRSGREADILWVEHRALIELLTDATTALNQMTEPLHPGLAERITSELSTSEVAKSEYPSVKLLDEENTAQRWLLDDLLTAVLSAQTDHPEHELVQQLHHRIRAHLDAQSLREKDLYFPVFVGPPV